MVMFLGSFLARTIVNSRLNQSRGPRNFEGSFAIATREDEEIVKSVVDGAIPSYSLESRLGDCKRAASIRREALQRLTGRSIEGLPLDGFDYDSILGQCCEMSVGYVQIPVGFIQRSRGSFIFA
ncbi:3-hydroxy-3-methylglutaryl coenzyme A reductase [Raphanus sativus]|nr:3-hydroxy-3-methylglutaryl coenzyme A reductase [Raphanus sativus]